MAGHIHMHVHCTSLYMYWVDDYTLKTCMASTLLNILFTVFKYFWFHVWVCVCVITYIYIPHPCRLHESVLYEP